MQTGHLCLDIGHDSLVKWGEQLCGDHVDVVHSENGDTVVVLADGLGSGVKASILSTLTARILSTMLSGNMTLENCISTITSTLPVCTSRQVAYSTFTVIRIDPHLRCEILQYDNPPLILLRNGMMMNPISTSVTLEGKKVCRSEIDLREHDMLVMYSDGVTHAGVGGKLPFGLGRDGIVSFLKARHSKGTTSKVTADLLLRACNDLYNGQPGDDTTVCALRVRRRTPVNLMMGPPSDPEDVAKMLGLFFAKQGKHIVCGGTTSSLAAEYLGKPLESTLDFADPDIPPIGRIEGVDLVTEGVITMNKVLTYAKDYLDRNKLYDQWAYKTDGASQIAHILLEEATDIHFYAGMAVNSAHQDPTLPINFSFKMKLVEELAETLQKMGKCVKVSHF